MTPPWADDEGGDAGTAYRYQIEQLKAERDKLRAEVRDRDQIEAAAADRIAKLSNENKRLRRELDVANSVSESRRVEAKRLRATNARLEHESEDAQDGAEHDDGVVRELELEVNRLKGLLASANKRLDAAQREKRAISGSCAKLEAENAKLRERVQYLVERYEDEGNAR